jgi:hypothetical protein
VKYCYGEEVERRQERSQGTESWLGSVFLLEHIAEIDGRTQPLVLLQGLRSPGGSGEEASGDKTKGVLLMGVRNVIIKRSTGMDGGES